MNGEVLLGRYRVEEQLELDGLGSVWRAVDLRGPTMVRVELWDANADPVRALLQGEAMAAVRHPEVTALLDFGLHEGTQPCLVTEWVQGATLASLLACASTVRWSEAFSIAAGVLDGLAALHDEGLVHADLSPRVLMLTQGRPARVKVVGLRRLAFADDHEAPLVNLAQQAASVPYMAPELLAGTQLQSCADVYAVGMIMWEAISGHRPFAAGPTQIAQRLEFRPDFERLPLGAPPLPAAARSALHRMLRPSPLHREGDARICARRLRRAVGMGTASVPSHPACVAR